MSPPREPTQAMEMAGWRIIQHYSDADSPPTVKQVWRAMYDAWVPPTPAPAAPSLASTPDASIRPSQEGGAGSDAAPDVAALCHGLRHINPETRFDLICRVVDQAAALIEQQAERIAALTRALEFTHQRRGELVIERDRYKAALGQYPEGRDVMLGGALAEIETQRKRAEQAEALAAANAKDAERYRWCRANWHAAVKIVPLDDSWKRIEALDARIDAAIASSGKGVG